MSNEPIVIDSSELDANDNLPLGISFTVIGLRNGDRYGRPDVVLKYGRDRYVIALPLSALDGSAQLRVLRAHREIAEILGVKVPAA
jgi:hypothetical protein